MRSNNSGQSIIHRLFLLAIILVLPAFLITEYRLIKAKKETRIQPTEDFYTVELAPQEDKVFTFFVLTQNDVKTIERNFRSIISQNYPHFRLIYFDQHSSDDTVPMIRDLIKKSGKECEVSVIERESESEVFESYYAEICKCHDHEVAIHLHGNDWLAHDDVLWCLNQTYSNPEVWLTYGQFIDQLSYKKGSYAPQPQKNIYKKRVQKAPWMGASLKTFYVGLFKKAQLYEALSHEFFLTIEDEANFLGPLAELGKAHVQFIPDVLYFHTHHSKTNGDKMKRAFVTKKLSESSGLSHNAQSLQIAEQDQVSDLILFSNGNPVALSTALEAAQRNIVGLADIYVIYHDMALVGQQHDGLVAEFPNVRFLDSKDTKSFKQSILNSLLNTNSRASYVLFANDSVFVESPVTLDTCITSMRKTGAYGFYFQLGYQGGECVGNIYSWVQGKGTDHADEPNTLEMALYRKIDIERDLKEMNFDTPQELIDAWAKLYPLHRVGLSFDKPSISPINSPVALRQ